MNIIRSLLDTDFYKLTMAQAILFHYPLVWVKYKFKCRNKNPFPKNITKGQFVAEINDQLDHFCDLRFEESELFYISYIRFFQTIFIEFLKNLRLNRDYIICRLDKNEDLEIIIEGPWFHTIWFEVPVLAIISELYHKHNDEFKLEVAEENLRRKIDFIKQPSIEPPPHFFKFADFGTRRRCMFEWQGYLLSELKQKLPNNLVGTSNVFFAKHYNLTPIGTMAHEWICAHQRLGVELEQSQKQALKVWADVYQGELGIALSDTLGFDAFLRDFNMYFAKLFDGCRHDSGDPEIWCERLIQHYRDFKIDPKTKTAIFSDGLTIESAVDLFKKFSSSIQTSFGIGTSLTNDVGFEPLQIVIKMVECNQKAVAKISDSSGKGMCEDLNYLLYLKRIFNIKEK